MRLLACAAALLVGALALPARGDVPAKARAALEWRREHGAEGCADSASLQRAVAARLRRQVFTNREAADLLVVGHAKRNGEGYTVRLGLFSREGRELGARELTTQATHCSALDDSLALVVAIMVDVPREREKAPPPEPEPATSRIQLPPRTYAPREPWQGSLALLGVLGWGHVPGFTPGIRARGGMRPPGFWWTEIDVSVFVESEVEHESGSARFSLLSAGLWLCPLGVEGPLTRIAVCAGQTLSRLSAEGVDFRQNRSQTRLLYDIGARGSVWFRLLPPLTIGAGLGMELPLVRDSFVLSRRPAEPEELFRPAFLAFTGEVGVGLELR